ncbi:MAG: carboxypeptidase regulatory-like domain-containing protein [Pyrinomonadaceae bacterium]
MKRLLFSLAISIVLLHSGVAFAQSTNASVTGTVADANSAAVPGAKVMAENVNTGVTATATANAAGIYLFPSLQPGTYRLTAEMTGFLKATYPEITLELSARVTVDFELPVGPLISEAVLIDASPDTRLSLGNTSVGGVLAGQRVQDLPLPDRNALGLIETQSGVAGSNFSGARIGSLNISRDGVSVQDQRQNRGVDSRIFTSVDLIQEVRVVTSPADAEFGRGSGQIQMITRSGTNSFHGSAFEAHRNTALNANTFFNNLTGTPRNSLIRNQFGGRLGGPIIRNRTFFFALYEGHRIRLSNVVNTTVLTQTARNGIFRFYPGVTNGNAIAAVPTVDLNGNPVRPATATGALQTVSLFNRDPNRPGLDPTGRIQTALGVVPLPNNYRFGDGLNTAGFTWQRPETEDFNHLSLKFDHALNEKHQLAFSYTREGRNNLGGYARQVYPDAIGGKNEDRNYLISLTLISTLNANMVNEFRYGALHPTRFPRAAWEVNGLDSLPKASGQPFLFNFVTINDPIFLTDPPEGRTSPVYSIYDSIAWQRGRHAFKAGADIHFVSSNAFNSNSVMPTVNLGAGGAAVQNISTIPSIGGNSGLAVNILNDLSGSVSSASQAFNSPGGPNPVWLAGEFKLRVWQARQFSWFVKDDFKVRPNLTLNLGVRYEFYGVPYDKHGKAVGLVGGSQSIFGISGTSLADIFQPGRLNGQLTLLQTVGKNSENERLKLYNNDLNNFAPAFGLSWALPWFGKDKTVLRMGYSVGYERNSFLLVDNVSGEQPGLRTITTFAQPTFLNLSNVSLPLTPSGLPLSPIPLNELSQTVKSYEDNLRTPYVQNWNVSLQRELFKNGLFEVRYVGNKGSKLIRGFNINEANIFENGILTAYQAVRAGGSHPLFESMFRGLNLGLGVINGTTVTAGASLRNNATTRGFFADGNVGGFASFLATNPAFTARGELLSRAGLPANFIFANPQFSGATLTGNTANSSYHSMQLDFSKRFTNGWVLQSNYTWSKALGEEEGSGQEMADNFLTLRNKRLDKSRLDFDFRHIWRSSGTYELPFGPGRKFLNGKNGIISRLVERWQMGAIYILQSGQPIAFTTARSSFNQNADAAPTLFGSLPPGTGTVTRTANGIVYFSGLQVTAAGGDPSVAGITTLQGLQARSTLRAIVDANGNIILVNPTPGTVGTLARNYLEGPGNYRLDINLIKRIRIREEINFELRADFINAFNHPIFGNPNTNINDANFGRITTHPTNAGNRIIVVGARINF